MNRGGEGGSPQTEREALAESGEADDSDASPASADRVERTLRIFLDEPLLWPVALAALLAFSAFGAAILVFALRVRGLFAGATLLGLIFLTVYGLEVDIRERRLRPQNRVVLALWATSALGAIALEWLNAFR